jgi:hypothetical protein
MAYHSGKTEHSGAKKGRGAFGGHKEDAKKGSNKVRRKRSREVANQAVQDDDKLCNKLNISPKTLQMIDASIENLRTGIAGAPVDLEELMSR